MKKAVGSRDSGWVDLCMKGSLASTVFAPSRNETPGEGILRMSKASRRQSIEKYKIKAMINTLSFITPIRMWLDFPL